MAKVQVIQKSRKEYKCNKCGKVIPVGSKYYKGEINFGLTIIRCSDCKLEAWEVTTSDWQLSTGAIINRWEENYGLSDSTPEELRDEIESIMDDQQERLDNMPEGCQEGDVGQLIQERIDACEAAMDELDNIDIDSLKADALSEYICDDEDGFKFLKHSILVSISYDEMDYDDVIEKLEKEDPSTAADLVAKFKELLSDAIVEALNNLEV